MQNQPATQSTNEFTLKEFRQRIRSAARRCAALEGLRLGEYKVEIDCRTIPVATPEIPTHAEAWPEGDDLNYSMSIKDRGAFLREAGVVQHGACVHVRISTTGDWGELVNVFVVWMGTPDADPLIIDAPMWTPDVELAR